MISTNIVRSPMFGTYSIEITETEFISELFINFRKKICLWRLFISRPIILIIKFDYIIGNKT
jgi:hypothetical protein